QVTAPAADALAIQPDPEAREALETTAQLERVRQQDAQFRAQALVDEARAAEARNDYQRALELYTQAVELTPDNQAAQQGRAQMRALVIGTPATTLDVREREIQIAIDEFNYTFNQNIENARQAVARGDYAEAQRQI